MTTSIPNSIPDHPIPFHAFGGHGPPILLAHANGYAPPAYRRFVAPLLAHHRVWGIYQRPFWPGARTRDLTDWHQLGADIAGLLDARGLREVIGIGHSLGGVATMYAAIERPELFRALVLIEPVFLPAELLDALRREPETAIDRLPLCRIAMNRRGRWPNRAAVFDHWRPKPVFARISDAVLWDSVDAAVREAADGSGEVELACPPEWESHIHATAPTDVWACIPEITQPTLALRGADTDTITPEDWALWRSLQPGATFVEMPELGHLLPLEAPEAVAGVVGDWVAGLG